MQHIWPYGGLTGSTMTPYYTFLNVPSVISM